MLHYVDTPITPKPIEYDKDESLEGESLRGSLIYTTKIFVDNDIFKGMNKKILEPTFSKINTSLGAYFTVLSSWIWNLIFKVQISNPEDFLFYIARLYLIENIQKCAYLAKFQSAK